jgi:hypothetical protein
MRRTWILGLVVMAAFLTLGYGIGRGRAAESPFVGTWKVVGIQGVGELALAIVKIEDKNGKPQASVVASADGFGEFKVEDLQADAKSLRFTLKSANLTAQVTAYSPKGENNSTQRLGALEARKRYFPLFLEQTDAKELDAKKDNKPIDGATDLQKIFALKDDKEKETALKEILDKQGDKPVALVAAQAMQELQLKREASTEELGDLAARRLKIAAAYGPDLENQTFLQTIRPLASSEKGAPVAIDLARKAEKQFTDTTPPARSVSVLKALRTALLKAGKNDDAKQLEPRIAKLEDQLDEEFSKTAVPFKPKAFNARKGESKRVAVVELFTGAQCPPCVSADIAFDAGIKSYKPNDVIFLQYHLHIPGPDPLTNTDTEARAKFYGKEVNGTPTMFLDGKTTPPMGGFAEHGEERYDALQKLINEQLEVDAESRLTLTAERKGDKIDLKADVAELKNPGENVRLRFVLIEDVVRYPGTNGQRLHHHVVRAFPGGVDGFALTEKSAKQSASVDLGELSKSLSDYLSKPTARGPYLDDEKPLNLKHLKAVALIQDNDSRAILQAVQVAVPEAK